MPQSDSFLHAYRPSALMLGTVQFGVDYGIANCAGRPDHNQVCAILQCAAEGGVNCLDTAAAYGVSEATLGRALRDTGLAGHMTVVTKVHPLPPDLKPAQAADLIEKSVAASLQRLELDVLPLCLFHRETDYAYIDELLDLRERGLIRHAGVSADNQPQPAVEIAAQGRVAALQLPMNIIDRRHENSGILAAAASSDMAVFVRSVYLQGLLVMPVDKIIPALSGVLPARHYLKQLAARTGMDPDELAIRYVLGLPGVTAVITGVETVEQMRRNVELFARGGLPADLAGEIRRDIPPPPEFVLTPKLWPNAASYKRQTTKGDVKK